MATWSKTFTQIDNVNGGQEFGVNDYPTTQGFNVPINNTQYLYNLLQAGFIKSYTISNGTVTIVSRGVNGQDTTTTMTIDTLNGYTKQQIDDNFVKYTIQSLTDAQKSQARTNINAPAERLIGSNATTRLKNDGARVGLQWLSRSDGRILDVELDSNDMYFYQTDENGNTTNDFYLLERLDALGFKSGSFTITGASSVTTTTNSIKKQGKRCIANLDITFTTVSGTQSIILSVPNDFKPKEATTVSILSPSSGFYNAFKNLVYELYTNGDILVSPLDANTTYHIVIFNAGWEL